MSHLQLPSGDVTGTHYAGLPRYPNGAHILASDNVMYFICEEKKSPYTAAWTTRRCAFNCETRYLYFSGKSAHLKSAWKKAMRATLVGLPAEAPDFTVSKLFEKNVAETDGDVCDRNLYQFTVEGLHRDPVVHVAPPMNVQPNALSFTRPSRGWPSKHSPRRGEGFQYDRTVRHTFRCDTDALTRKVVDTIRDVLADDGLCPPVNGGLPPFDPRNSLPFARPTVPRGPFQGP